MSLKKVFHTAIRVSSWSHAVAIGSIALILSACTDYVDKYEGDYKDDYGDRETFIQNLNSANLDLASVCSSGDWFWCASQDGAYTTSNDGKIETYSSGDVKFTFTGTDDNAYKFSTNELGNDLLPYLRRNGGISVSVEGSGEWDAGLRINTGNYFDLLHEKNVVVAYENSCPGVKINLDVVTAKDYMERGSLVKEGTVLYRYSGELPAGGFQVLTVDPDQLTNEIGDSKWRTAEFSISATENRDRYTSEITIEFTESCPEFKDGKGLNLVGIGLQSTTRPNSGTVKSSSSSGEGGPGNNGGSTVKSSSSLAKSSSSSVKSSSSSANTFWTVTCKGTPNAGTITWEPQFYYVSALEQATAKYSWTLNGALDSETNTAIKPTVTYLADGEYFAQLSVTVNGQTKTTKCSALIESGASGFLWKGSDKLDLVQTDFGSGSKWYFGTDQEGGGSTTIQFPEINPYDECEGKCGMVWFGNTEYPYATVGFNLDENGTTYDVSAWKGLCIAYYSPEKMYLKLDLQNISDYGSDLPAAELPSLSSMDEYRVENIEWASFKQGGWGNASTISGEEAARILKGVVVTFAGSTGGSQFFNIYQIGSYGKCGNVQPKNVDMSQFRQTSAWDYLNPNISYGEISDSRDGQVYKTVKIGNQTWMAQNLNYVPGGNTASYCYDDNPKNCNVYGRLYTWSAAMDSAGTISNTGKGCGFGKTCTPMEPVVGICPDGWHLPSSSEWETLFSFTGTNTRDKLKSLIGWTNIDGSSANGTDDYGFSAVPGGYMDGSESAYGMYFSMGNHGNFWTATELDEYDAKMMYLSEYHEDPYLAAFGNDGKKFAFSVRCVKGESLISSSSSEAESSSSFYKPSWEFLNPDLEALYDTIIDDRDGQVYKTIAIGKQVWMAENLNYRYQAGTAELDSSSFCYMNDPDSCAKYGRAYLWSAAMDSSGVFPTTTETGCGYYDTCSIVVPFQGICPDGWRLPSKNDWERLFNYMGEDEYFGLSMKSKTGWTMLEDNYNKYNGTDDYGFSANPTAYRSKSGTYGIDADANFWSSNQDDYIVWLRGGENRVTVSDNGGSKGVAMSVRCVKDLVEEPLSGTFTDTRDSHEYKFVKIGNQTWMAENLNYQTDNSRCYDADPDNCTLYGQLYTWADAVGKAETECGYDYSCVFDTLIQGVCPDGWHMPSRNEFAVLEEDVGGYGGKILKSTSGWHPWDSNGEIYGNGVDAVGFNGIPTGVWTRGEYGQSRDFAYVAVYWSATQSNAYNAHYMLLRDRSHSIERMSEYKDNYYSVRCVKNE